MATISDYTNIDNFVSGTTTNNWRIRNIPLLFGSELNSVYKDILNCTIVKKPFRDGRTSDGFFLKKRGGLTLHLDWGGDYVIDYSTFDNTEYAIVKDADNIIVKKRDGVNIKTISQQPFNSNVYHSFKKGFSSPRGEIKYSGTVSSVSGTSGVYKITVTGAGWNENEFAGKFVAITEGPSLGSVFKISSNNATDLTLQFGWDTAPTSDSKFKIYDDYGEVLSFIGNDGIYSICNDSTTLENNVYHFSSFGTVVDADWNDGRIFAINIEGTVSCSATETNDGEYVMSGGYFSGYINSSSVLGSVRNVLRVVPFNNVILLLTHDSIYIIKQVNVERNGTTFNTYNVNIGTDYIGLHSATAIKSYNTGLYLLTSKNSLVSLNIEDGYQGKYKISTEDMGIDIQQWLDNIKGNDKVSIGINNDEIDLSWNDGSKTTIFKYSMFYGFWYRRETALLFSKIYANIDITYIGDKTYRYNDDINTDDSQGGELNTFEQGLRWMVGEDDIFQLKTILYHKLYLGANTSTNTIVHYKFRVSGETYEYAIPLSTILWLQKSSSVKDNTSLGESILGYNVLGGSLKNTLIGTLVSDVNVLEIPLGLTFTLAEIWLTGDFECGGHLIGELRHEEQLTPFEDVVPYF